MQISPLLLLIFFSLNLFAQPASKDCQGLHNGKFYYYPVGKHDLYIITRNDTLQMEVEFASHDTSWWKASWPEPCTLSVNLIDDTKVMPLQQKEFMRKYATMIHITQLKQAYYIFDASFINGGKEFGKMTDTMWLQPKRK